MSSRPWWVAAVLLVGCHADDPNCHWDCHGYAYGCSTFAQYMPEGVVVSMTYLSCDTATGTCVEGSAPVIEGFGTDCSATGACPAGLSCIGRASRCTLACRSDGDCPADTQCKTDDWEDWSNPYCR